jgi:hypothetical protein
LNGNLFIIPETKMPDNFNLNSISAPKYKFLALPLT